MPCSFPLRAFRCANGEVVFHESSRFDVVSQLSLPCGQCTRCRLEKSRQWAMRCMHEASCWKYNSFVTLTYDDNNLPVRGMLEYPTFQRFMKRLRVGAGSRIRFYMCGEYGEENWRPHFHACLFGTDFSDKRPWRKSASGDQLFRSDSLEKLWPFGNCEIGGVTFESAGYVARYCVQKVNGHGADEHYRRVDENGEYHLLPEFNRMSLKPGIGALWFDRWKSDVFPHDSCVVRGKEMRPAGYYLKLLKRISEDDYEFVKHKREIAGRALYADNTEERLLVKDVIAKARLKMLIRSEI